jgi:hypothetical protein
LMPNGDNYIPGQFSLKQFPATISSQQTSSQPVKEKNPSQKLMQNNEQSRPTPGVPNMYSGFSNSQKMTQTSQLIPQPLYMNQLMSPLLTRTDSVQPSNRYPFNNVSQMPQLPLLLPQGIVQVNVLPNASGKAPLRSSDLFTLQSQMVKKHVTNKKADLSGAGVVVVDQPPIVSISASGWKAVCLTLCKTAYVRNNKRGGLKNLRCFPHCLSSSHNPLGFCGSSIYIRVWLPDKVATTQ